jgi:hypothetical protein
MDVGLKRHHGGQTHGSIGGLLAALVNCCVAGAAARITPFPETRGGAAAMWGASRFVDVASRTCFSCIAFMVRCSANNLFITIASWAVAVALFRFAACVACSWHQQLLHKTS